MKYEFTDSVALRNRIAELEAECQGTVEINIKLQDERDKLRAEKKALREAIQKLMDMGLTFDQLEIALAALGGKK